MMNMHEALVEIVLGAIKEQYVSEKAFYTAQLSITPQSWDRWKKGNQGLKPENMEKISRLFTEYEWMLVQKVCRNATFFPEVKANPVNEYLAIKFHVAQKWVNSGTAELEFKKETEDQIMEHHRKQNTTILIIENGYDFWSYKDIIELRLPGIIQQQIKTDKPNLLEWFNKNIHDTQ